MLNKLTNLKAKMIHSSQNISLQIQLFEMLDFRTLFQKINSLQNL